MSQPAIKVEQLTKRYRIGLEEKLHDTLGEALMAWVKAPLRNFRDLRRLSEFEENGASDDVIWALDGLSFDVNPGEVVAIIGRNGAGKSTLLKILSRITEPTSGRVVVAGRVSSLLEVGTGFHPELTGRENAFLNGAILGMTKAEITAKFEEIVDFAEIGKFIDTPVKRYSSGMRVRLAFAVAAHLEPEVLLIDEVLAVGDAGFQKKCLGKMNDVAREGRTVLFVSHDMSAVTRLCDRTIWLEQGRLQADGQTEDVVAQYLTSGASLNGQAVWPDGIADTGVDEFRVHAVRLRNEAGEVAGILDARLPFHVEIDYEVCKPMPPCSIGFRINTVEGVTVFATYDADQEQHNDEREPGRYRNRCEVPGYLLSPGRYVLTAAASVLRGRRVLAKLEDVLTLDIADTGAVGSNINRNRKGIIRPRLEWQREVNTP